MSLILLSTSWKSFITLLVALLSLLQKAQLPASHWSHHHRGTCHVSKPYRAQVKPRLPSGLQAASQRASQSRHRASNSWLAPRANTPLLHCKRPSPVLTPHEQTWSESPLSAITTLGSVSVVRIPFTFWHPSYGTAIVNLIILWINSIKIHYVLGFTLCTRNHGKPAPMLELKYNTSTRVRGDLLFKSDILLGVGINRCGYVTCLWAQPYIHTRAEQMWTCWCTWRKVHNQ